MAGLYRRSLCHLARSSCPSVDHATPLRANAIAHQQLCAQCQLQIVRTVLNLSWSALRRASTLCAQVHTVAGQSQVIHLNHLDAPRVNHFEVRLWPATWPALCGKGIAPWTGAQSASVALSGP